MKNVEYYNAGAGSGKTHQLISILTDLIAKGEAKPNELILTTFTEKAAADFREKAKARLYKEGSLDAAIQIDNAMIGTVHSVCKQMIDRYWYLLGLAPGMGVMDDESKAFYMSQSLSDLPTKEESEYLYTMANEFSIQLWDGFWPKGIDDNFWRDHLESIIEYATNYGLTDFNRSKQESKKFLSQFVNTAYNNVSISDDELKTMLQEARSYVDNSNRIKKKDDYYAKFNAVEDGKNNKTITWRIKAVATLESKYGDTCAAIGERISHIWSSSEVYDKLNNYLDIIFGLAERWQNEYAEFKREKNMLDFSDMEYYMLQLMRFDEAKNDIAQRYRYLLVDEFQDSSPIQVKLFNKLSELMAHSYWVGDYKQSIYGFRGTDIGMIKAVKESIDTDMVHTLGNSWRSLPPIVDANNHIFTNLFAGQLQPEEVCLDAKRAGEPSQKSLRYCISDKSGVDVRCIAKLLREGAKPKEITVLARYNNTLDEIATELHALGIASNLGQKDITATQTWTLLKALLGIVDSQRNTLARAQVAMLTDNRYCTREIVEARLTQENEESFLADVPLVGKTLAMRDSLRIQSVASLVEQLVIELGLPQVLKQVEEDSSIVGDCLQSILSYAKKYEQYSLQLNMPASISGFIEYFESIETVSFGNPEGVQLLTYHGSKGLENKYVILTSLDSRIESGSSFMMHNIFGVQFERTEKPTSENPNPEVYLRLAPWIYDSSGKKGDMPPEITEKLHASDTYLNAVEKAHDEERRLFYVGMTRPRDVQILAVKETKSGIDLTLLSEMGCHITDIENRTRDGWDIFGTGDRYADFTPTESELEELSTPVMPPDDTMLKLSESAQAQQPANRRYISPSGVKGTMQIGEIHDFHYRLGMVGNNPDMTQVGNCIHHIFACIDDLPVDEDYTAIEGIIRSHGLEDIIMGPERIAKAWDNLKKYLTDTYGTPVHIWHERPFRMERDGQTIVGSIDLVWQTSDGDILIDFKSNQNGPVVLTNPESKEYAGHYGGQICTYREALEAAGETVLKTFLYYHVSGLLVELK